MIVRYHAKCDSCGSVTVLRLGIGYDANQIFKYECQNCNQQINGSLKIDQETATAGKLELSGARCIDTMVHDYVITIHPDFPTLTSRGDVSSPFMDTAGRHNDDFIKKIMKRFQWKNIIEKDAKTLKKIFKNYKQKKWTYFSHGVKEYLPDWPIEKQVDRNRALYQILELCLFPVVTSKKHLDLITFLGNFLIELRQKDETLFMGFVTHLDERKILENLQNYSFKYTFRFFDLGKEITPILIDWNPNEPDIKLPKDLRIMSDTPFDKMKSFYVDGYELACDALIVIQGLINIKYRMDFDSFPEHPTNNKGKPFAKSLDEFNKQQSNAPKLVVSDN